MGVRQDNGQAHESDRQRRGFFERSAAIGLEYTSEKWLGAVYYEIQTNSSIDAIERR